MKITKLLFFAGSLLAFVGCRTEVSPPASSSGASMLSDAKEAKLVFRVEYVGGRLKYTYGLGQDVGSLKTDVAVLSAILSGDPDISFSDPLNRKLKLISAKLRSIAAPVGSGLAFDVTKISRSDEGDSIFLVFNFNSNEHTLVNVDGFCKIRYGKDFDVINVEYHSML